MIGHVLRRTLASLAVLLVATFLCYLLVVNAGDPYADLRAIADPQERAIRRAERADALDLDVPPVLRYLHWLRGATGCLLPGLDCTLGTDRYGRDVTVLLGQAMGSTLRLVIGALVLAVLLGVALGVVAALRYGSLADHGLTASAFMCFSAPPLVLAVIVKEFGALGVNEWLDEPRFGVATIAVLALLSGLIWMSVLGGDRRRRGLVLVGAAAATGTVLGYLSAVRWFADPALGPAVVGGATLAAGALLLGLAGVLDRRTLAGAVAVAVIGAAVLLLTAGWLAAATGWGPALGVLAVLVPAGAGVGALAGRGGIDRARTAACLAGAGATAATLIVLEQVLLATPAYRASRGGVLIPTFGWATPEADDGFWGHVLDTQVHLVLPCLTLMLFTFAGYLRYTRTSMLEQLSADYVSAARAHGLPERSVVLGHALRNALLPVSTVITLDLAAVIGGAIVVEQVFGIVGMGQLFEQGLSDVDPAPVMAFVLVTGLSLVVCTAGSDLLYRALDPRVRG